MFDIPVKHRQKNFLSILTCVFSLKSGDTEVDFSGHPNLKGKDFIGVITMRQNSAGDRKSTGGKNLISRAAMSQGKITLQDSGATKFLDGLPLDFIAYDPDTNNVGDFAQLIIQGGFDIKESKVEFPTGAITEDSDLIIMFLMGHRQGCQVMFS